MPYAQNAKQVQLLNCAFAVVFAILRCSLVASSALFAKDFHLGPLTWGLSPGRAIFAKDSHLGPLTWASDVK